MSPRLRSQILFGTLAAIGLGTLGVVRGELWAVVAAVVFAVVYAAIIAREPIKLARARAGGFPAAHRAILEEHIRFYRELDAPGRARFEECAQRLLALLEFEAVGGATLDDETRLLAVAGACVLVQNIEGWTVPTERSVLIYPENFDDEYQLGVDGDDDTLGMVHTQGPIVFSHKALVQGWSRRNAGTNVSIHEWAHVLDLADGFGDGVPSIVDDVDRWNQVLEEELAKVRKGRSALRPYAGTNRAELFAVAAEAFHDSPRKLKTKDAELYQLLVELFGRDPLAREPSDAD